MKRLLVLLFCVGFVGGCVTDSSLERRVAALEEDMVLARAEGAGKKMSEYDDMPAAELADGDFFLVRDVDEAAPSLNELSYSVLKGELDTDGLKLPVSLDNDSVDLTSAANTRGHIRVNNEADANLYTLPGAAAGLCVCFYDLAGGVITVDPEDGTDTIYLDGATVGAGDTIESSGAVGEFICLIAVDDTRWITWGKSGTWADSNP